MKENYKSLETIVKTRRSNRNFTKEMPPAEDLARIIESAVYAPYGGATGLPLDELRKIFVFKQDTNSIAKIRKILCSQARKNARKLNLILRVLPFLKPKMQAFVNRVNGIAKNGVPALDNAAYFIVLAERRGFPPVEKQSMAHALENMWLTATDLGLGFQLISITGTLSANKDFLKLLDLPKGKYGFDGCAVGYTRSSAAKEKEYDAAAFVTWME